MPDPIAMLKEDHKEAKKLLKQLADSKPGARRDGWVKKLDAALTLHMKIEESIIYPLVAECVGEEEANVEHGLARDGLEKLRELDDEPGFGAAVAMLTAGLQHHIKEEEHEVFPELKCKLDRDRLMAAGDEMVAAKRSRRAAAA